MNLQEFYEYYKKKYSLLKANFISTAYMRDVLGIQSEYLRAKKKSSQIIELITKYTEEFEDLLKHDKSLEKEGNTYLVVK